MSEQQDRGDLNQQLQAVPCDHCSHPYKDHWYKRQGTRKEAGCNSCFALDQHCPGFHAGTVNVDTSPPCANCNHTLGAHVISYKGDADDYCNILECLCRKYGTANEEWEAKEETVIETTITVTTTITVDLPITVEDFQDELTRISVAHGPDAEITKAVFDMDGGTTAVRIELTIE